MNDHFHELEKSIYPALVTYSNVHRGSGHFSAVTTLLYEEARKIVLEYLHLSEKKYIVLFCSPLRAADLSRTLRSGSYSMVSSAETGLDIGVRAIAIDKRKLPLGAPLQSGGGTTIIVSANKVAWAGVPDRFEAGTPSIINVIAFARSLQLMGKYGRDCFRSEKKKIDCVELLNHDELDAYSGKDLSEKLNESVIGRDVPVPVSNGTGKYINLDYAASTPTFIPVWNTYKMILKSSPLSTELISRVKLIISEMVNAPEKIYEIHFTLNTTEAINILASGTSNEQGESSAVLLTILEHNSNDLPWRSGSKERIIRIYADSEGFISAGNLEKILEEHNSNGSNRRIRLLSFSGASNVTGSCNNIEEISRIAHRYGVAVVVDGAQLISHRRIDMERCGIDFLVFSGHKVYAPFGTGVLIARKGMLNLGMERINEIRSSGEENLAGIAALGKSLNLLLRTGMEVIMEEEQEILKYALDRMSEIEGIKIHGISDSGSARFSERGPVIAFSLKKVWPDKVARGMANHGIGIRYGCHCAHLLVKNLLHVGPGLERFQFIMAGIFSSIKFPGVARVSFGIGIARNDIEKFIESLKIINAGNDIKTEPALKTRMNEFSDSVKRQVFISLQEPRS